MGRGDEHHGGLPPLLPTGTPPWITPDLVSQTMAVWSRYSPRPLGVEDAVEMLVQVGELYEVLGLIAAQTEESQS